MVYLQSKMNAHGNSALTLNNFFYFKIFLAADQSRMMQEQMTMQAGGMQDPKQVSLFKGRLKALNNI